MRAGGRAARRARAGQRQGRGNGARRRARKARRGTVQAGRPPAGHTSSRRSALGARRSALGARRSALGARRSALGARRSALGARRSALGARRSALGARRFNSSPELSGDVKGRSSPSIPFMAAGSAAWAPTPTPWRLRRPIQVSHAPARPRTAGRVPPSSTVRRFISRNRRTTRELANISLKRARAKRHLPELAKCAPEPAWASQVGPDS